MQLMLRQCASGGCVLTGARPVSYYRQACWLGQEAFQEPGPGGAIRQLTIRAVNVTCGASVRLKQVGRNSRVLLLPFVILVDAARAAPIIDPMLAWTSSCTTHAAHALV